jgi:hypothetical protein
LKVCKSDENSPETNYDHLYHIKSWSTHWNLSDWWELWACQFILDCIRPPSFHVRGFLCLLTWTHEVSSKGQNRQSKKCLNLIETTSKVTQSARCIDVSIDKRYTPLPWYLTYRQ